MNDLELDIKKGLHLYSKNDEIVKEGKKMSDENTADRKTLKAVEDQKNIIRKVLHKIKTALNEQEQLKSSKTITPIVLEENIKEIETCMQKGSI